MGPKAEVRKRSWAEIKWLASSLRHLTDFKVHRLRWVQVRAGRLDGSIDSFLSKAGQLSWPIGLLTWAASSARILQSHISMRVGDCSHASHSSSPHARPRKTEKTILVVLLARVALRVGRSASYDIIYQPQAKMGSTSTKPLTVTTFSNSFSVMHFHRILLIVLLAFVSCHSVNPEQIPVYVPDFDLPDMVANMTTTRQLNRAIFNPTLYSRIREVWFGDLPWGAKSANEASQQRWFTAKGDEKANFDRICYNEFNPAIEALSPGKFPAKGVSDAELTAPFTSEIQQYTGEDGLESTKTALSLMILLDQIPRNLYRTNDTLKLVYEHYDNIAVALARHVTSTQPRLDLHPSIRASVPYRQWFQLPLMHSEKLEDHRRFQSITAEMKEEFKNDEEVSKAVEQAVKFEDMHVKAIEKFGRYPHRNECLGRQPTKEEKEHLESGGQTFGVAG